MKRTAMGMVGRPQAKVALFHFLDSVQWSGPWQSVGKREVERAVAERRRWPLRDLRSQRVLLLANVPRAGLATQDCVLNPP